MKPRTKLEKRFCDLANSMPEYSRIQDVIEWSKTNVFPAESYYWKHRGKNQEIWCQCCGHREPCDDSFLVMESAGYTCPHCGAKTKVKNYSRGRNRTPEALNISRYVTVVDVVDKQQVLRVFDIIRGNSGNEPTTFESREIYQCWIDDKGHEVVTTSRYSRSLFYFHWDYGSEYHIGRHYSSSVGYSYYEDIFTPGDNWIYPKMKFSKYFRTVRLTKKTVLSLTNTSSRSELPQTLAYLLKYPYLETLQKTGYNKLYLYLLGCRKNFSNYRHAVNICHRNKYPIDQPDLWVDYMDDLIELGLDTHNAHYVCPADLKTAHRQMLARVERKRNKVEFEKRMNAIASEEPKYRNMRKPFFGLSFIGEGFNVVCISSVKEVFFEAKTLHHCMFTHAYYRKEGSLLMSARSNETGDPIESLEISLRDFKILQCRGDHNCDSPLHNQIMSVVESHLSDIRAIAERTTRTA